MKKKPEPCNKPHADDCIAICSFRYALGRQTYMPSIIVEWLIKEWPKLTKRDRSVIKRELEGEIQHDNEAREQKLKYFPLGWDCDRREWEKLWDHIKDKPCI